MSTKVRLHNGGYSIIEMWDGATVVAAIAPYIRFGGAGANAFADVIQNGSIEAPALFRLVKEAAKKLLGFTQDAQLSGVSLFQELFGDLNLLPGGCLRSIVCSDVVAAQYFYVGATFQNNGNNAPLYVDFKIHLNGANDAVVFTLDFQHSIIE